MKTHLTTSLLFFLSLTFLLAKDAEEIQEIASLPHDRSGISPELAIYPDVRAYMIDVVVMLPGQPDWPTKDVRASEKVVEGRYVVTEFTIPAEPPVPMTMVVEYDEENRLYRKWVLNQLTDEVELSVGVGDTASGAMSWLTENENGTTITTLEQHSKEKTLWSELIMVDGTYSRQVRGTATAVATD